MSGKILAIAIVVSALLFGAGVYYFQVYYYYAAVEDDAGQVFLTPLGGGAPELQPGRQCRAVLASPCACVVLT